MKIVIDQHSREQRLDSFLSKFDPRLSRSQWQKEIKAGEVLISGKKKAPHYFLREGDILEIKKVEINKSSNNNRIRNELFKLIKVIEEDEDYLVISKPAGLIVHPNGVSNKLALTDWLVKKYPEIKKVGDKLRPGIVHRLDKDVSGLMVIARTPEMSLYLQDQFRQRKVMKQYNALVHNQMQQDDGEINTPIRRSESKGMFVADIQARVSSKKALTRYKVLKKFKKYTLLQVNILTGRTHQIRVHLRSIGHPVVGDKLYITHDIKKKKPVNLGRLWLYASKLGFKDSQGNYHEFKVNIPTDLNNFIKALDNKSLL